MPVACVCIIHDHGACELTLSQYCFPQHVHCTALCYCHVSLLVLQVQKNVELTTRVVRAYIIDDVETKLAFDIPASWRFFMVSSLF